MRSYRRTQLCHPRTILKKSKPFECPVYTTLHPVERYWRVARLTKILKELPRSSQGVNYVDTEE
jgi:hypothetical protein